MSSGMEDVAHLKQGGSCACRPDVRVFSVGGNCRCVSFCVVGMSMGNFRKSRYVSFCVEGTLSSSVAVVWEY